VQLIIRQFMLFSVVGAVGTAAHFGLLIALVQFMVTGPVPASIAGFAVGALVNYGLNYHVTFRSKKPHQAVAPKFVTIALAGLGLNTLVMALATSWLHYLFSQSLATFLVLAWNFLCNRFWTFKESSLAEP
jgi:putative flippase GtrA